MTVITLCYLPQVTITVLPDTVTYFILGSPAPQIGLTVRFAWHQSLTRHLPTHVNCYLKSIVKFERYEDGCDTLSITYNKNFAKLDRREDGSNTLSNTYNKNYART